MENPLSPEMLDASIVQLKTMLDVMPDIPDYVKVDGTNFIESLDKWAAEKRKKRDEERAKGQPAQQV